MASAQNPKQLSTEIAHELYLHDPADATVATKIAWVDMNGFKKFMAKVLCVQAAIVTFKLFVSASADGSNPVLIREHAAPTTADAAGDSLVLECTAEELPALLAHGRYVSAEVDMDTNTDTAVVSYIRAAGREYSGLTGDQIAA